MSFVDAMTHAPIWSQPPVVIVADLVSLTAFVVVAAAIVIDFANYHKQARGVAIGASSLVETGSMTAFFVVYYLVIRLGLGEFPAPSAMRLAVIAAGLALMVLGAALNVAGRVELGSNWANQIKIYDGHTLKTRGPYAIVRHPLYASLIWIFVGGALVYSNVLSLVLTFAVFVPMMMVRAGREEALLIEAFGSQYAEYQTRTGRLIPRVRRR